MQIEQQEVRSIKMLGKGAGGEVYGAILRDGTGIGLKTFPRTGGAQFASQQDLADIMMAKSIPEWGIYRGIVTSRLQLGSVHVEPPALVMPLGQPMTERILLADPVPHVISLLQHADALTKRGLLHLDIKDLNTLLFPDPLDWSLIDTGSIFPLGAHAPAVTPIYLAPEMVCIYHYSPGSIPVGTAEMLIFSLCWLIIDYLTLPSHSFISKFVNSKPTIAALFQQHTQYIPTRHAALMDSWASKLNKEQFEKVATAAMKRTSKQGKLSPQEQELARMTHLIPASGANPLAQKIIEILYEEGMSLDPAERSSFEAIIAKLRTLE